MAMETRVIQITPQTASQWLEKNTSNRRLDKGRARLYAQVMSEGKWSLTHQGIAFDEQGNLVDGQHRLYAIVMANVPVEMNVTFGVKRDPGELLEIDTGRRRSYVDIQKMAGVSDSVVLSMAGVIKCFLIYKIGVDRNAITPYTISDYIKRHYNEVSYIATHYGYVGKKHANAIAGAAALSALYAYENRDAIAKFGQVWVWNDTTGTERYNPKIALDCREKIRSKVQSAEVLRYIENAIRVFAQNMNVIRPFDCYKLDSSRVL